jgi:hypothetical protein
MADALIDSRATPLGGDYLIATRRQDRKLQRPQGQELSLECGREDLARRLRRGPKMCPQMPIQAHLGQINATNLLTEKTRRVLSR